VCRGAIAPSGMPGARSYSSDATGGACLRMLGAGLGPHSEQLARFNKRDAAWALLELGLSEEELRGEGVTLDQLQAYKWVLSTFIANMLGPVSFEPACAFFVTMGMGRMSCQVEDSRGNSATGGNLLWWELSSAAAIAMPFNRTIGPGCGAEAHTLDRGRPLGNTGDIKPSLDSFSKRPCLPMHAEQHPTCMQTSGPDASQFFLASLPGTCSAGAAPMPGSTGRQAHQMRATQPKSWRC
jgi:hypothetical protein